MVGALRVGAISGVLIVLGGLLLGAGCGGDSGDSGRPPAEAPPVLSKEIRSAEEQIEEIVDVPVSIPAGLPSGMSLNGKPILDRPAGRAQLSLLFPADAVLTIQYGTAGFDGCEVPNLREISIDGQPALIAGRSSRLAAKTVLWPATRETMQGVYGLTGSLPESQLISYANSMGSAGASAPRASHGC